MPENLRFENPFFKGCNSLLFKKALSLSLKNTLIIYFIMRKYSILLLLPLLFLARNGEARHIPQEEAEQLAAGFYGSLSRPGRAGSAVTPMRHVRKRTAGQESFYVFNAGTDGGYVIVSADSRAHAILGYATEGSFDYGSISPQFKAWLESYEQQLALCASLPEREPEPVSVPVASGRKNCAPLLGNIRWGQGEPFNRLCPDDPVEGGRTPVGCVATAAAQIMRYYGYPAVGRGQSTYTTTTHHFNISETLEGTRYDWDSMLDNYNKGYTEAQAAAAARLSYHVGVSCHMNYNKAGSGAWSYDMARAMVENFSYDENIDYTERIHYDEASWETLLRNELDQSRPILYVGYGTDVGHAFVCDGYDGAGFFHFNWGWDGMSDGYFRTSAMDPSAIGTGGGSGGFNHSQTIVTNIQPPTAASVRPTAHIHLTEAFRLNRTRTGRTSTVTLTAAYGNYGIRDFSGTVGAALFNAEGGLVALLSGKNVPNVPSRTTSGNVSLTFQIPADVADGTYRLQLVQKESGAEEYTPLRAPVGTLNYMTVSVNPTYVEYAAPDSKAALVLTESPAVAGSLYRNRKASFSISVKNEGEEYYSYIGLLLRKKNVENHTDATTQYIGLAQFRIPKDSVRILSFRADNISVEPGDYELTAVWDPSNSLSMGLGPIGPESVQVTDTKVQSEPTSKANIKLEERLTVSPAGSPDVESGKPFTVTARVKNYGGYDEGVFALIYFDAAGKHVGSSTAVSHPMPRARTQTLTFSELRDFDPGSYKVYIYQMVDGGSIYLEPMSVNGTGFVMHTPTGIVSIDREDESGLQYSLQGRQLTVTARMKIQSLTLSDMSGRVVYSASPGSESYVCPADRCPAGVYLLTIVTGNRAESRKILLP